MKDIIGHEKVVQFFENAVEKEVLHHAYCLIGPQHVGKTTVVRHVAAQLFNIDAEKVSAYPDYIHVTREKNAKTGKTKKYIDVDQIRHLRDVLKRTSFHDGWKIAVIEDAHLMNQSASNALLKTLEEPTQKTVLFLTTTDEKRLLPTIRSRCHSIYLPRVEKQRISDAIVAQGLEAELANQYAQYARGLPGHALNWIADQEAYEQYTQEVERFTGLIGLPFHEKIAALEDVFGDKTDHIATRQAMEDTVRIWQLVARDILCEQVGIQDVRVHDIAAKNWPETMIQSFLKEIDATVSLIHKNIHPRLLIERLILHIP